MNIAARFRPIVDRVLGGRLPFGVRFWDGSSLGPADAAATIVVRSPVALRRMLGAPGELGIGRAYVAGDLDLEGDWDTVLSFGDRHPTFRFRAADIVALAKIAIWTGALRPVRLEPPLEEARMRGRLHSKERDAQAIRHHYDVGNDFYRLVLGPTLVYSCAYFSSPAASLESAQTDKMELICRKLRLRQGEQMLDVGCGWGSLAIHAAKHHGVSVVGITLSKEQAELAEKRAAEEGVADRVAIRLQDERDIDDGPYDAISSVGMFEHVGTEQRLQEYFRHLHDLLRPHGRLLNHGIANPAGRKTSFAKRGFGARYVFPDGELHEVGRVISLMQGAGFEVRDLENLREHYALTLRQWVANLQANREDCVRLTSAGRYRVWRLYMSVSARGFERGDLQVHQVLAVRSDGGPSGLPLRRSDSVLA